MIQLFDDSSVELDELASEEVDEAFDDEAEELDDELVAYCERILAKVLSLIFTLALSRALAIT